MGDASVAAACKNGGITKIQTVDEHGTTILGIYSTWTTIVTGQ
jgi:predicted nucleic acid-binding protein